MGCPDECNGRGSCLKVFYFFTKLQNSNLKNSTKRKMASGNVFVSKAGSLKAVLIPKNWNALID